MLHLVELFIKKKFVYYRDRVSKRYKQLDRIAKTLHDQNLELATRQEETRAINEARMATSPVTRRLVGRGRPHRRCPRGGANGSRRLFRPDRDEIGTNLRSFFGDCASATLRHDPRG